jgi:TP901 family phage tail tape measure protein
MAGRFSVEAVFKATDRFSRPIAKMQARTARFTRSMRKGMRGVNKALSTTASGLRKVGAAATVAGAALAVVGAHVTKTGMEFEQAVSGIAAVRGVGVEAIADLEKQALKLGSTTKFTATEVAQGMELMGRAGFEQAEIMSGIEGVLSAAAAEGIGLAETVSVVSNALKGMGLPASRATDVADMLALASTKTNSSILSLGESLGNVASTARQFKIPISDVIAAVAGLQDVGLDASVAGSALNTMLTKLAKATPAMAAKMKKFGVTFQDAEGNMLPLGDVLANMAKAAEKSGGNMKQVAFFADLVGLRGQKAALNLKDMLLSGKFKELADQIKKAGGAAKKMAETRMNNLAGDIDLLKSAAAGLETKLFKTKGGQLRKFVKGITAWVEANADLIAQDFSNVINQMTILGEIFAGSFKEDLAFVVEQFGLFSGKAEGAESVAENPAWRQWADQLGSVAAGIATVLGVLFKVSQVGVTLINMMKGGFSQAFKSIADNFAFLVAAFVNMWDDIKAILDNETTSIWQKGWQIAKAVVKGFLAGIGASVKNVWDIGIGFAVNFIRGAKQGFDSSSPSKKMMSLGGDVVKGFIVGVQNMIPDAQSVIDMLTDMAKIPALELAGGAPPKLKGGRLAKAGDIFRQQIERERAAQGERPEISGVAAAETTRSVTELIERNELDITIKDETGNAKVTKKPPSGGKVRVKVRPSGGL